jgi:hypothetical protein
MPMIALQQDKIQDKKLKNAYPISQKVKDFPIYITGKLKFKEIGSNFVKPGNYIYIKQYSQVYAWIETSNKKQSPYIGVWTDSPTDPKTFKSDEGKEKIFAKRKWELTDIYDKDLVIVDENNNSYKVDLSSNIVFNNDMQLRSFQREELILDSLPHIGSYSDQFQNYTVLYEKKECEAEVSEIECQRVITGVYDMPKDKVTIIGDLEGDKIIPFENRILIGNGDFQEMIKTSSIGYGYGFFQFLCILLACFGFYILSNDVKKISFLSKLPSFLRYFVLSLTIGLLCIFTVKYYFITLILLLIGFYYLTNGLPETKEKSSDSIV